MTMKTGIWLRRKREKRTISFPSLLTLLAIDDSLNLFYEEKRMKRIPRVIYRSCLIHLPGFSLSSVLNLKNRSLYLSWMEISLSSSSLSLSWFRAAFPLNIKESRERMKERKKTSLVLYPFFLRWRKLRRDRRQETDREAFKIDSKQRKEDQFFIVLFSRY